MSSRVTRSSARLNTAANNLATAPLDSAARPSTSSNRKRKASAAREASLELQTPSSAEPQPRKRARRSKAEADAEQSHTPARRSRTRNFEIMSSTGNHTGPVEEANTTTLATSSSKRKSSRKKESKKDTKESSSLKPRTKKSSKKKAEEPATPKEPEQQESDQDDDIVESEEDENFDEDDAEDNEPEFDRTFAGPSGSRFESAMRNIHGVITRTMTELRVILENLRRRDDPAAQRTALEELAQVLLMANEDTLAGHFSPDPYIKELVPLMEPNEVWGEIPEMMLMACRCIANMMEALPASTANIVYGGAVPILCKKLLEIHYIDVAEQALSTLEKISVEFPGQIVREGGLTACLTYLDFFATSVQRTAVTIAANCCRSIPADAFYTVSEVMPILRQVLGTSDQKVLEQACLCVSRIIESFKYQDDKLAQLVDEELMQAMLRLLLPGTTNLISPRTHTMFLRGLAFTVRASADRAAALIKMNVVDTLYQILTGVSPPSGVEDMATKIDSVMIMQSLIHRPKDQILETLNVVCEILPPAWGEGLHYLQTLAQGGFSNPELVIMANIKKSDVDERLDPLKACKKELRRFTLVLFPTLTDAYSSTVNLNVRQKVLLAQLKMLCHIDTDILEEALQGVSYSSFLAAIISQGDHPILVMLALQAAEVLISRLEHIYRYQFYREGVFAEISKLGSRKLLKIEEPKSSPTPLDGADDLFSEPSTFEPAEPIGDLEMDFNGHDEDNDDDGHEADQEDEENEENEDLDDQDEMDQDDEDDETRAIEEELQNHNENMDSDTDDYQVLTPYAPTRDETEDMITKSAKQFIDLYLDQQGSDVRHRAAETLTNLQSLVKQISVTFDNKSHDDGLQLFKKLASYFGQDSLDSVTSYELLSSKVVDALLEVFEEHSRSADARSSFLQAFMGQGTQTKQPTPNSASPVTPFSVLVHKLQDLLSRAEHFEVMTVHSSTYDGGSHGTSSALSKQVRLRLIADDDFVPEHAREMMVSVHALATLKSISDFLRTRMLIPDRARELRRQGVSGSMAALAQAISRRVNPPSTSSRSPLPPPFPSLGSQTSWRDMSLEAMRQELSLARKHGASAPPPSQSPSHVPSGFQSPANVFNSNSNLPSPSPVPAPGSASASRPSSAGKSDDKTPTQSPDVNPFSSNIGAALIRRRSRRNQGQPPENPSSNTGAADTLECADEKEIKDEDTTDEDVKEPIRRVATQPVEAMAINGATEAQAVNFEVASGRLTARRDDGTRIATPLSIGAAIVAPPPPGSGSSRPASSSAPASTPAGPPPAAASSSRTLPPNPVLDQALRSSLSATTRALSSSTSALNLSAANQDWHLEFYINGEKANIHASVYRVIHFSQASTEVSTRTLLSNIHTIRYKKVNGPAPPENSIVSLLPEVPKPLEDGLPASLAQHPTTASILRLLSILHGLNSNIDDVLSENQNTKLVAEPLSQFVNTKLTAKLNRQLEEPLIVASSCLPSWSEDLSRFYPFLFPFETRHLFLRSTSFGFGRSLARWSNDTSGNDSRSSRDRDERLFLGRLQRQKVRVQRPKMLESAMKVMEMYAYIPAILEVEFFDEVGTGLGPTLEFYALVSKETAQKKLKLWRTNESDEKSPYVFAKRGLFPAPMSEQMLKSSTGIKILSWFGFLGKFLARSMLDSRIVDIHFNPTFFRLGNSAGQVTPSLGAVQSVDETLAQSLRPLRKAALQKKKIDNDPNLSLEEKLSQIKAITISGAAIEDLALDFTLPGYPDIELIPKGADIPVNIYNVEMYVDKVLDFTLGSGVIEQVKAFQAGFSQVFPYEAIQAFTPDELVMLFGQVDEDWSLETLMDSIKADHGFNLDSKSVRNLLQIMCSYNPQERRDFLQFITGSPKLPIGGFKALTPMLTVVCKPREPGFTSDDYLPSVMTCVNYLKLPDYSSIEVMREKLNVAIKEGQGAFHLS